MHLLTAQAGGIEDGAQPVDLQQTPGDIVVLTSADTEIAGLAGAKTRLGDDVPSVRLASLLQLTNNFSVDLYIEKTLHAARLIVVRVLGGPGYWPYGLDELRRLARRERIALAVVSGAAYPDATLQEYSTLAAETCDRLWSYLVEGGAENYEHFLRDAAHVITSRDGDCDDAPPPPKPLGKCGVYRNGTTHRFEAARARHDPSAPTVAITFYRALLQGGDTAVIDALADQLEAEGMNVLPVFASSLKDPAVAGEIRREFGDAAIDAVVNVTAFSISKPADVWEGTPLDAAGAPVFQAVLAGSTQAAWEENPRGLSARDIAMNVALPEIDGRVLTRAISFKAQATYDDATQTSLVRHAPDAGGIAFTAQLVARWARLRRTPVESRRVAIVLSNYPSSDGQIANGVGLDTPAGTLCVLRAMSEEGYALRDVPDQGTRLIQRLQGEENSSARASWLVLPRNAYDAAFAELPDALRREICDRWGAPGADPMFDATCDGFRLPIIQLGAAVVGVQPGRGAGLDAKDAHHDQTIVPPHNYVAFYAYLRHTFDAHAVIHMGKHGNLEWMPGKALALSPRCYPQALFGPLPHVYPF
ncbi:MAG: cobaltochelatase subunit CobN, partial [Pseudomonadota bacterium]